MNFLAPRSMSRMIADALCAGVAMSRNEGPFPMTQVVEEREMDRFRRQMVMALTELPPCMSVGELRRHLDEGQ